MKKIYLLIGLLVLSGVGFGQTTLSAGDIAIFGVNTDNPDDFGFVLLVDIDAGTEIRFTDSGWKSDNTFRGNEGAVKYTAPTALTAGTEITYQGNNADFIADNDATVGTNGFNLSGSGDQVFAFQGVSTSPTFIYAVQTNSNVWQADATESTNSAIPQGLTDGTNAAAVGNGSGAGDEWDNAAYDKDNSTISGTAAVLLAAISNNSNWVGQNSPRYDLTTYDFTLTGGSSGPDNPTAFLAATTSTSEIDLSWTRNSNLDQVMLVWSPDNSFGTPVDGDSYAAGDTIPGGDSVLYMGVDTTYAHTGLAHGTHYYYKAFSLDGSVNYSAGITDDASTFKDEPDNHVASFATGTPTAGSIPLTWNDNDGTVVADSFLIMINTTGTFTAPVDGTPQAEDLDVSDGAGVVHVAHGGQTYTWLNLQQSTHYYFQIYPYTNSGSAIDYKTDGTVPAADTTTPASNTATIPYSQTFDADLGDCSTYSVSGSTKEWGWNSTDQAAEMNGYNSGDVEEDWLILPGINFDNYSNEQMTFDTWYKYGADDADNYLKLMYSVNYGGTGDPSGATWTELSFTHPSAAEAWTSSGTVDLSGISGTNVYIAYKYHYNSGSYRYWEVDNIQIEESSTNPEPSNYPTAFTATADNAVSITNAWTDATGAQLPSGYVIYANLTGIFTPPTDGTPVSDDTDMSDGSGVVNVAFNTETYQWTGLTPSTQYYFTIYPYSNSGSTIDYKTDGTAPAANTTTPQIYNYLFISEVSDPKDHFQGRFVELYNGGTDTVVFSDEPWYLVRQAGGGSYADVQLSDTVLPGEAYTIGYNNANFSGQYGFSANQYAGLITGNGDDGYFLYYGEDQSSGTLIDAYGVIDENGSGKAWEYTDGKAVRKRSVGTPNSTWTASEWVITDADVVNMTPGQHFNYVTWEGNTDTDWDTKTNWDNGFIPDVSMDITIPATPNNPVIASGSFAQCWDLTVDAAASLTIASNATEQGGLVVYGTATGNVNTECYTTTGQWHGLAAPVSGQTANALYLNGSPDVWMKYWNESDTLYHYITTLSEPMGDMKGWMVWVDSTGGLTNTTFTFEGSPRSGIVTPTESITRLISGSSYGYNFVGNPFTSAIDWDDTTGWTKTNIDTAIYTYNNGNWATYSNGTGTNGGSRYIAMNQGFFVQVTDDGSTSGTLTATNDVQVNNSNKVLKNRSANNDYSLIRLEISANSMTDETVVKLQDGATNGFDGSYDAHKMFSFNADYPQIFSTANGNMSINTVPVETGYVNMDVKGKTGDLMTISATERTNLNEVWLVDELTGIETDLTKQSYTFTYDNTVTDRFTLHFSIVNVSEQQANSNLFTIYASNREINVVIPAEIHAGIEIYNLLGQKVAQANNRSGLNRFVLPGNRYYVVKVFNEKVVETKKVLIQ